MPLRRRGNALHARCSEAAACRNSQAVPSRERPPCAVVGSWARVNEEARETVFSLTNEVRSTTWNARDRLAQLERSASRQSPEAPT